MGGWRIFTQFPTQPKSDCVLKTVPEFNSFLYRPRLTREVNITKSGHCSCFLGGRTRIRSVFKIVLHSTL